MTPFLFRLTFVVSLLCCAVGGGCTGCFPTPPGADAGHGNGASSGGQDAGRQDAGRANGDAGARADGGDAGNGCGPSTPGFGAACGQCGSQACNRIGELHCADPGFNACHVCGHLDLGGGIVGRTCGVCGVVGCMDGGLLTQCQGEHPPNICGGCLTIPKLDDGTAKGSPDAGCSQCQTGVWNCQATHNDLSCWGGRAATNTCGGCGQRCILYHANMSDLSQGAFVLTGTRAIIEDVGEDLDLGTSAFRGLKLLTLDPLVTGPAGLVLEAAVVYLSPTNTHTNSGAFALGELYGAYSNGIPGDPVRQYHIYPALDQNLASMRYVIIYDGFLGQEVSVGELLPGAP